MAAQARQDLDLVLIVFARTTGRVDFDAVAVRLDLPDAATAHARFLALQQALGVAPLVGPLIGASGTAMVTAVGTNNNPAAVAGPAPPPPQPQPQAAPPPALPLALPASVVPVVPAAVYDSNNRPPKTAQDLRRRSHKECCRYRWRYQCSFAGCLAHERCLRDMKRHYGSFHGALPAGFVFVCVR